MSVNLYKILQNEMVH